MPSGKKKRKAAKKKQENQSNNHHPSSSSAQTHEGDEVSSPASQDRHSNQNNLTEEEEEEIDEGDNVSNHPSVEGVKIVDKPSTNTVVKENFVPVEREFKIDDESDRKDDGGFEHDETASKSYDGGSSGDSSTSSSSDDESHEIKSSQAVVENIPAVTSEVDLSFAANNNSVAPSMVQSEFKENGEKKPSSEEDKVGISNTTECVAQETDDRSSPSCNPPIASVNNGADQEKDSGISEPLLAPAPHPVQTTSWKGCCGLLEVFAGSGR